VQRPPWSPAVSELITGLHLRISIERGTLDVERTRGGERVRKLSIAVHAKSDQRAASQLEHLIQVAANPGLRGRTPCAWQTDYLALLIAGGRPPHLLGVEGARSFGLIGCLDSRCRCAHKGLYGW